MNSDESSAIAGTKKTGLHAKTGLIRGVSLTSPELRLVERSNAYERFARSLLREDYRAVYQCEQSVVFTDTHVLTRIVNSTALTDDDVACLSELTTEKFDSESFAFRLTAVLGTTYTFFVCHVSLNFNYATMSSMRTCDRY